mmetsp:Transcript_29875/g.41333  ORF Transcript_29875/g.41333 Transcript_29875/m.41333 type:complete len:180 (-) Transcript_29875:178-717(-)|eukprot:CAMPEP_0196580244 /NCGR_PEP_ID=MMETSP1081-20130531/28033_1 /TAXON_ID=36882 /ORGANISM="Pyramimonas amylifera, Strain CCMP720" /LENGTH=179 /DNA_ID=CAMNT_0041900071 /DNA_START=95 /DNA_END=634 /DNA_ORIENTATION=+
MIRNISLSFLLCYLTSQGFQHVAIAEAEVACPVCHSMISRFQESLKPEEKKDQNVVESKLQTFCDKTKEGKDAKFCYYIVGASSMKREISKPVMNNFPPEAICKKLGKKDPAICELEYRKTYTFDLSAMTDDEIGKKRIKDLRSIMSERNKECVGCIEKPDFVAEVLKLKALEKPKTEL